MKLYVANCTNQVQDFIYRLPETASSRQQRIEIGGQIQISGTLSKMDIDAVIEQHTKYGMVSVDEIDRTRQFIGICYSVDKPVDLKYVARAFDINKYVLDERGKTIRQEAAIAVSNSVEEQGAGLTALDMSVVEEQTPKNPDPKIAEGVRVSRLETPGKTPTSARGRGRRAA